MNRDFKAEEFLKGHKEKSNVPSMMAADRELRLAMSVVDQAEAHFPEELTQRGELLLVVYRNFVVNAVTSLEVFLKTLIQEVEWGEKGYQILLSKAKVNLSDAYDLFAKKQVTRSSIIANYYSFQNLTNISEVFDALSGQPLKKIIHDFEMFADGNGKSSLVSYVKSQYDLDLEQTLSKLFVNRNAIVHENVKISLTHQDLNKFVAAIQTLIFFMVGYFLSYSWLPEDQRPVD